MILFSDADRYTVAVVVLEGLYTSTLAVEANAALSDTSILQGLNHCVCTASSQTIVDAIITCTSVSVTSNHNLRGGVLVHVSYDVLNLLCLRVTDNGLIDLEEDIAAEGLSCSYCGLSGNLNNLLYDLLNILDLGLWSGDELGRVGLAKSDLCAGEQVEL